MASRAEAPAPTGRPGTRNAPGIHDVAEHAGVSTATVSRALRGVGPVRTTTRERVLASAAALGYVASPTAASLVTGRTGVVAVLVPFVSRWFFATALDAFEQRLRASGLHVLLVNVGTAHAGRTLLHEQRLLRKRVDAVLVLSCDLSVDEIGLLGQLRVPVVTLGVDVAGWHLVGIDDQDAGSTAMQHLLDQGHRRIAYLGGDTVRDVHVATAVERRTGVLQAARTAGAPLPLEVIGDWSVRGGEHAAAALLDVASPPTAVLAASDEMAVGVLCAARQRGLRVPRDLSVIGIDDHELAWTHRLTTVRQPVHRLGTTAADLVVQQLAGGEHEPARQVRTLPTNLVVRASTAPPQRR